MQFLVDLLAAMVVWAATFAFSQFGVEVDLSRPSDAREERIVQRTRQTAPAAIPATDCPDSARARLVAA